MNKTTAQAVRASSVKSEALLTSDKEQCHGIVHGKGGSVDVVVKIYCGGVTNIAPVQAIQQVYESEGR